MIQVDVFWSFAMGGCLATMAGEHLKTCTSIFVNQYFVYTLCYLSVVFSPSGVYLLWQHTAWETMFFYGPEDLSGLAVCAFASTNVLLGILGFYVCALSVRSGRECLAHTLWTAGYVAMFTILTFGYDRFLYAGSLEHFRKGYKYPIADFFDSEVFYTLLGMSVFIVPPLFYATASWPAGPCMTEQRKTVLIRNAVLPFLRLSGFCVTGFLLLFAAGFLPYRWRVDRIVAFAVGSSVFGFLVFLPLFFIPTVPGPEEQEQWQRRRRKDRAAALKKGD